MSFKSNYLIILKKVYKRLFTDYPNVKIKVVASTERHGSVYGGWHILKDSLNENSVVYSVGIGKDISFDISIIKKYSCSILGYDPTPGIEDWIKNQNLDAAFKFIPKGLSNINGSLKFYKPKNANNISHSTEVASHTDSDFIEVPCVTLNQMLSDNNHSKIDLLKMDIEGEELNVIDDILSKDLIIDQLLIEFHHFFSSSNTKITEVYIDKLDKAGFELFYISDSFCEYSFLKKQALHD